MTDVDRHINQWLHNRQFLSTIEPRFHDWIVTVAFYTALHAVDSLLAYDGVKDIINHDTRNSVLVHTNRYQHINRHFKPLYQLSRTVRYMVEPQNWVPRDQIKPQIFVRYLYPIEASVQKLTGRSMKLIDIPLREA